jgi:hypothetical protein
LSTLGRSHGATASPRAAGLVAAGGAAIGRYGDLIGSGLLALVAGALLAPAALRLPLAIPFDYNEGWNAYQALRAIGGQTLYPPPGDLTANNYPPLSFYLVGWAGTILGDHIVIGRAIALISLLVVACNIGLLVRTLCGTSRAAVFGALLFLAYVVVYASAYVGTNDPQWLAHVLMAAALLVLLRGSRSPTSVIAAAVLALLSGLVKHSLIALPLAITAWLWWHDRRAFRIWLAASALLLAGALALLYIAYGRDFFVGVLGTPRAYTLGTLAKKAPGFLLPMVPLLGASLLLLAAEPRRADVQLLALYALCAGLWGLFTLGSIGTDANALFDLLIGTTIAATLALERLPDPLRGGTASGALLRPAGMIALMLPILVSAPVRLSQELSLLANQDRLRREIAGDIRFIAGRDGPVACESLALCYWAGKDFALDFFITGQKLETGSIDEKTFVRALREHRFAAVQVCGRGRVPFSQRLPERIDRVVTESYRVGRFSPHVGFILVPGAPGIDARAERRDAGTGLSGRDIGWAC